MSPSRKCLSLTHACRRINFSMHAQPLIANTALCQVGSLVSTDPTSRAIAVAAADDVLGFFALNVANGTGLDVGSLVSFRNKIFRDKLRAALCPRHCPTIDHDCYGYQYYRSNRLTPSDIDTLQLLPINRNDHRLHGVRTST